MTTETAATSRAVIPLAARIPVPRSPPTGQRPLNAHGGASFEH